MKDFRASRRKAPSLASGMLIVDRTIGRLKPDPAIPRHHSNKQNREIANGLEPLGDNLPILIDRNGSVIASQHRLAICRKLSMTEPPTLGLDHHSQARARAFNTIIRRRQERTSDRAHHGASDGNLANLADAVEGANAA